MMPRNVFRLLSQWMYKTRSLPNPCYTMLGHTESSNPIPNTALMFMISAMLGPGPEAENPSGELEIRRVQVQTYLFAQEGREA